MPIPHLAVRDFYKPLSELEIYTLTNHFVLISGIAFTVDDDIITGLDGALTAYMVVESALERAKHE